LAVFRKTKSESEPDGGGSTRRRRSIDFDSSDAAVLASEIDVWVTHNRPKLGEVMLEIGAVDPDDLIEALQHQKANPTAEGMARLGEVLLQLGKVDERELAAALAQQFGIPFADLQAARPEVEALERVGEELARKYKVIPLRVEGDRVFMAIADPLDTRAIADLTHECKRIGLMMGAKGDIDRLLDESYNVLMQAEGLIQAFELSDARRRACSDGRRLRSR
jgi:type IV pilus assembly protein PilB